MLRKDRCIQPGKLGIILGNFCQGLFNKTEGLPNALTGLPFSMSIGVKWS
jgi:hypothetical protein